MRTNALGKCVYPLGKCARILAKLVTAPLLGLAFIVFLPILGFGMAAYLVLRTTADAVREPLARVLRPAWTPAYAYFVRSSGRRKERK